MLLIRKFNTIYNNLIHLRGEFSKDTRYIINLKTHYSFTNHQTLKNFKTLFAETKYEVLTCKSDNNYFQNPH
jgi:hypothetical protein